MIRPPYIISSVFVERDVSSGLAASILGDFYPPTLYFENRPLSIANVLGFPRIPGQDTVDSHPSVLFVPKKTSQGFFGRHRPDHCPTTFRLERGAPVFFRGIILGARGKPRKFSADVPCYGCFFYDVGAGQSKDVPFRPITPVRVATLPHNALPSFLTFHGSYPVGCIRKGNLNPEHKGNRQFVCFFLLPFFPVFLPES